MQEILSALLTVCTNIIVLCSVPFIWWLVKWRKEISFFEWVGLYRPRLKAKWWVLIIFAILYGINYFFDYQILMPESDIAIIEAKNAAEAVAGGLSAKIASFMVAMFANGLCEELFFRGFLTKRLIAKFGLYPGMIIPSAAFALLHNVLWLIAGFDISITTHIIMFSMTTIGALLLAYLNEKIYNGSIIPSILLHGIGNFI